MKRDYAHTFALEMIVLGCQVLTYKLAADYWGSLGFSEYALARRALSLLHPALMLGLAVALPRYAARASASEARLAAGYLHAGAGLVLVALVLWLGFLLSWDRKTASILFGDEAYASFMPALGLMLSGLSAHVVAYGYLRGTLRLRTANWLQLVNVGLLPVAVFLLPGQTVANLLTRLGLGWLIVGGAALSWLLATTGRLAPIGAHARELVRFGIARVPGEFLHMAMLGVPAIVVAHSAGVEAAGRVAFALSVVGMFGSAFAPIGLVLLPTASRLVGAADFTTLRKHVRELTLLVLGVAVPLAVLLEVGAGLAVRVYLGPGFDATVPVMRVALIGVVPYALFMALRSVVDAVHVRALNTMNLAWAFAAFVAASALSLSVVGGALGALAGVTVGLYVLGALTMRDALRSVAHGA